MDYQSLVKMPGIYFSFFPIFGLMSVLKSAKLSTCFCIRYVRPSVTDH